MAKLLALSALLSQLALVALLSLSAGCSGGECGPGEAPADGVSLEVEGETVGYGDFTSSPNNDCPETGHPTSLTLAGAQVTPPGTFPLTFCLPKPDEIGAAPIPLDGSDDRVQVIDVSAEVNDCIVARESSASTSGAITFIGYCGKGTSQAGYAIELDAEVPGTMTCDATQEPVTLTLSGRAAVEAINF